MVTIIKNQLLKHLSRFTKNLSPEQISLSALRGSGELADLTLDEALLTELLELPTWLRLTSASCNRVSFRIQWTKLKTVPIVLSLDEVRIAVEVCQEPRVPSATGVTAAMPGKYSYIHKVIDGISVNINAVQIHFNCEAFSSSVQLSRVTLESRTPQWARGDLRLTRIKSPDTGQLLIFKELEWQMARVEAQAKGPAAEHLPPLRLLAGSAHCRIVIKKLLSDCSVVGCRLVVQPEPLAWALTDGQLRAALACATALAEPARKATAQATRVKAARKMQAENSTLSSPPQSRGSEHDALTRLFARHDVRETSYHLLAPRIDLHLCDDPGLGRSEKPSLSRGGALQVTLLSMQADFFPYHKASDDRRHWRGYREAATPHTQWLNQSLLSFCSEVVEMFAPRPAPPPPGTDNHVSYSAANPTPDTEEAPFNGAKSRSGSQSSTHNFDMGPASSRTPTTTNNSSGSSTRTRVLQQLGKLMTTCLILRIDDFTVYKVSTGAKTRESPRPLVCAERATLPGDAGLLHAELTSFYYPGDVSFPVPPPKMYAQLSPVRVSVDVDTCVWLAAFLPHVARALTPTPSTPATPPTPLLYMDVRLEAIMPKIVLEAGPEHVSQQRDRPKELQICSARASLTNVREPARPEGGPGTRADLASIISSLRNWEPSSREFPLESGDIDPIHEKFIMHADGVDDVEFGTEAQVMWKEARDVWCARTEPFWFDLCGARATNGRPTPLLDAIPLTLWACFNEDFSQIWALARAGGLAGLQLNHYQMLFLLRKLEHMSELAAWLAHDARRQPNASQSSILLAALVPQVEVTLVLPSSSGGLESSRDVDQDSASVLVDSSSLQDLKLGSETNVSCVTAFCGQSSLEVFMSAPLSTPIMEEETHMQPSTPPPVVTFTNNFASFSSMRRGLTSLVTSIDGALAREDSRSDAASTASSDSERYVVVGLAGDTPDDADNAFRDFEHSRVGGGVEVAAEVLERSSSPSERSVTSSCHRRDLVSTSTWRINNIYAVYQSCGDESSVRVTGAELSTDECSSIPWDEFQSKFAMRARNWTDPSTKTGETSDVERTPPHIMARLQRREMPLQGDIGEKGVLCPSEELLRACVRELRVSVGASTALALAEFAEDESVQPPMPIEIIIENVELHVIEDRPARSISSPPPQPLDVTLSSLCVSRSAEGVVRVGPAHRDHPPSTIHAGERETELGEARQKMLRLARENEELRKRLTTLAHVMEDNRELRVRVDEANVLRECAHAAQQETASLLADKRALLDTVRVLQEQLSSGCVARGTGKR